MSPHRVNKEHWMLVGVQKGKNIKKDVNALKQIILDRAEHENMPLHVSSFKIGEDFVEVISDSRETTDWFLKTTIYLSEEVNSYEDKITFYLHPQGLILKEFELEENLDSDRLKYLAKWQNEGLETNGWLCLGKKEVESYHVRSVKYLVAVDLQTVSYLEKFEGIYLGLSKVKLHHFDNRLFETTWYGSPQKHAQNYFDRSDLKGIDSDKFLHLVLNHFQLVI